MNTTSRFLALACALALCAAAASAQAATLRPYQGKYESDARLARVLESFPARVAEASQRLTDALGVTPELEHIDFEIRDIGRQRSATRGQAHPINDTRRQLVILYAEHVVLTDADLTDRLAHELKHAAFQHRMGDDYRALPAWVREGLAVYGAGQLNDRAAMILGATVFAGREPLDAIRSLDQPGFAADDYLPAAAAFQWLGTRQESAVRRFCALLLSGAEYRQALADCAGIDFDEALRQAHAWTLDYARGLVGDAGDAFLQLRQSEAEALTAGRHVEWLTDHAEAYAAWAKEHDGHALAANALFRAGRGLVLAGGHERGRELLRRVIGLHHRTVLADDALHWIVQSYAREGDQAGHTAAREALLRDFSWSRHARE